MTLGAGSRVGPYEIVALAGSGGMGEVYRARDPRLGREVAIKVLPERFARSADRLRRFEREARAAGALSHPGILTVFDVGAHDGMPYIVTELLDGDTMRAALRTQRFGVRQCVVWGVEVARALACAHDAGILHRDLKPDNLFLTRDGRVKILDFGIAKLFQPEGGTPRDAETATRETLDGGVAGTAAYMSPEQIRDEPLDERCDVFALGATLFEMLSQRAPFAAPTQSDIIATVLRDDPPPLAASGGPAAPALEAVVRRCLEKRRESRYRSAREVAAALEALLEIPGIDRATVPRAVERPRGPARRPARWIAPLVAIAVAGAALAVARGLGSSAPSPSPLMSLPRDSPQPLLLTSSPGRELEPALARDGQRIAFVWDGADGENFDLYTKVVGTETALRLTTHPAYDGTPAWSPDGRSIAFVRVDGRRARVVLVPSTGGPERVLRELEPWFGTSVDFSPDGRRIAVSARTAPGAPFGIVLVSIDTGEETVLTRPDPSNAGDAFPAFSPDGETIAFARLPAHGASLMWAALSVVPTRGGDPRIVQWSDRVVGGLDWTADGREIVFSAADHEEGPQLWRIPVSGDVPALPVVRMSNLFGAEALTQVSRYFRVSIAEEGGRMAYAQSRYHTDIWKVDVASPRRSPALRVVASTQVDEAPQISPDGRRIAFSSNRMSKSPQIWTCDMAGAACAQLTGFESACGTPRWAPDSRHVVFDAGQGGQSELFVVDVETAVARRLTMHDASDVVPSWSRDGKSVYFASDRTGSYEVWKIPAEGGEAARVTLGGGFAAFESQDASEVFFTRYGTPGLWAMPVGGGPDRVVLADEPACWGYWALGRRGIFLLDSTPAAGSRIAFLPYSGAPRRPLAVPPAEPACGESGIALSPDERTLLYVGTSRESDVVMIDGFR